MGQVELFPLYRPFAVIENDGSTYGSVYFVRIDHIGRPVFSTGLSGAVVWRSEYLPFGEITFVSGTAEPKQVFPGQWFQGESGLHQNWMRDYDPVTGSYLQPDPLGLVDGPAVYAYAKGAPGVYVDPRGEQSDAGRRPITGPMWPGESYPGELGGSMIDLFEGGILGAGNLIKACVDAVTCAVYDNCTFDECGPDTKITAENKAWAFAGLEALEKSGEFCSVEEDGTYWCTCPGQSMRTAEVRHDEYGHPNQPSIAGFPKHHDCPHFNARSCTGATAVFTHKWQH